MNITTDITTQFENLFALEMTYIDASVDYDMNSQVPGKRLALELAKNAFYSAIDGIDPVEGKGYPAFKRAKIREFDIE